MGHSDELSKRQTRDGGGKSIFNTEAKKHDKRCQEMSLLVTEILQKTYPNLEIERWKTLKKSTIHDELKKFDSELGVKLFRDISYLQPDGGIVVVKDKKGKWRVILIAEAKVQGTNKGRIERGLPKQATGNALERATKNIAEAKNFMLDENHFPYVLFGHGDDLTEREIHVVTKEPLAEKATLRVGHKQTLFPQAIPDRITSANYGLPTNQILVNNRWVTRSDGREIMLQPASLFMRLDPWTNEEMFNVMWEIAHISLSVLGLID